MAPSSASADVVIIGGGPGGYVAAIRAAQLGLNTVCVEMDKTLGGTCVNVGCIPSKALLTSSEHYEFARQHAADHGIRIAGDALSLDLATMLKRKDDVVGQNTRGILLRMLGPNASSLRSVYACAKGILCDRGRIVG